MPVCQRERAVEVEDDAVDLASGDDAGQTHDGLGRRGLLEGVLVEQFAIDVGEERTCAGDDGRGQQDAEQAKGESAGDDADEGDGGV